MIGVVVVDDDADAAEALADLCAATEDFRFAGWAASTQEGLRLVTRVGPDVVLADIRMPGPDGVVLTRSLAGAGRGSRPRVVMLTAFALDEYLLAALAAGASGFLPKSASWAERTTAPPVMGPPGRIHQRRGRCRWTCHLRPASGRREVAMFREVRVYEIREVLRLWVSLARV